MKYLIYNVLTLTLLMVIVRCSTFDNEGIVDIDKRTSFAYDSVIGTLQTRTIGTTELGTGNSFNTHQAWFKLISSGSVEATENKSWNLAFWTGTENRVILNYSVKTQASHIAGVSDITTALSIKQSVITNAYDNLINGGTMNMGDFSTFDFHRDKKFVIKDLDTIAKVYLLKVPEVEIHPDTTGNNPVKATNFLISVKTITSGYSLNYVPVEKNSSGVWEIEGSSTIITVSPINKNSTHQYMFVSFIKKQDGTGGGIVPVQPAKTAWDLGLSSVLKKNYMSDSSAYAFNTKGFVLNNNPDVSIYRVQTTGSNAGAPGSYDINFNYTNDPALDPANSIDVLFGSFKHTDIDGSLFKDDTQEEIGQYWRFLNMGQYKIFVDRFYVVKLKNKEVYKLKFSNIIDTVTSNSIGNGIKYHYEIIAKEK